MQSDIFARTETVGTSASREALAGASSILWWAAGAMRVHRGISTDGDIAERAQMRRHFEASDFKENTGSGLQHDRLECSFIEASAIEF